MKLETLPALTLREKIRAQEITATDCVLAALERIKNIDGKVHAFLTLTREMALERAKEIDGKIRGGQPVGALAGLPIAIKDNICLDGVRTTCASHILENFTPPYTATVVDRVAREDGVVVGKTNMDEFAMGSSTETSYFGPTYNPWDLTRVPGGSSGGSGACVAAGETPLALGSDTGGSVRCPASFCGVVGVKPTYGLVSRYGLIAYANSLEQIGPMGRTVGDCALLLTVISGYDERDATSVNVEARNYLEYLINDISGVRIGMVQQLLGEGTHPAVEKNIHSSAEKLVSLGAKCETVSLPTLRYALPAYYLIAMAEASSNLARYDGLRYGYAAGEEGLMWHDAFSTTRQRGFGAEVRRRIILGTYALSAGYYDKFFLKAVKVANMVRLDFLKAFKTFDVLMAPAMPFPAFKIGERIQDPLALYMSDIATVPVNLAGIPAISVPSGFTDGLPIGLQFMAPPFREDLLLRVAYTFEQNTPHHAVNPPL
ncbi:MAG: Asp-tRNA(Asn)/Glu-tRNA(Gln) amidotransferase subunit GatA [Candidatus Bathyarchaeia archaeon]